jgi:single-strand DNA-binding protein
VVAWGSLAEICKQHLTKGQHVYIEGRLQTRFWEDNDGNKHSSTEIVASEMIMLGDKKDLSQSENEAGSEEEEEFPYLRE